MTYSWCIIAEDALAGLGEAKSLKKESYVTAWAMRQRVTQTEAAEEGGGAEREHGKGRKMSGTEQAEGKHLVSKMTQWPPV